jgi:hypothetical protein
MDAASIEVVAADRRWVPSADLVVDGDPGMPNEYTSLELTWHDDGIEQRVYLNFASDGIDWWVNEIRTYDGQIPGDWITPAQGEYFKSPLGTAFAGDLDLPNLHIRDITLEAFLRPSVCDNPVGPTAMLADYPMIDSPVGVASAHLFRSSIPRRAPPSPCRRTSSITQPTTQRSSGSNLPKRSMDTRKSRPGLG